MSRFIETPRLTLGTWEPTDVPAALEIYGAPAVSRWLTPEFETLASPATTQATLLQWHDEGHEDQGCTGHWAVRTRENPSIVGDVSLRYAPPGGESVSIAWALSPAAWGHGYAAEAANAVVRWAIHEHGVLEVFAIVQPDNERAAATAQRIGMEWVRELGHLTGGRYQVYRIRHSDLAYED